MDREVDEETRARAARRYRRLRRRFWRCGPVFLASWAGGMAVAGVAGTDRPVAKAIFLGCWVAGFATWCLAALTWSALLEFRCPRCGKRFLLSWTSSWPGRACKHCGLGLG